MARLGRRSLYAGVLILSAAAALAAQRGYFRYLDHPLYEPALQNVNYDGRFTFVRLKYQTAPGGYWDRGLPAWAHGYPRAERNLLQIMNDVSYLGARLDGFDVLTLDDPALFRYPVAYIIEVGWWTLTDKEAAALRAYLQKGGFLIVDDFKVAGDRGSGGWDVFDANMRRVLPGARFVDMDPSHPIFHCFFDIDSLETIPQYYNRGRPIFRGLYEDNDPRKRLEMVVNYNTDVSQFWEYAASGFKPVADTNDAFRLGVNYVIYGMTH